MSFKLDVRRNNDMVLPYKYMLELGNRNGWSVILIFQNLKEKENKKKEENDILLFLKSVEQCLGLINWYSQ